MNLLAGNALSPLPLSEDVVASCREQMFAIIGAAMEVHNELGWGLLESIYNEALCIELSERSISYEREKCLPCFYKEVEMKKHFQMDLVVDDIIIELKSVESLGSSHRAQLFHYMRLTRKPFGLLINFGKPKLQGERYAYLSDGNECVMLDKNMHIIPR